MLKLENISKTYPNSTRKILDNLSFEINEGDSIAIVGPSGVGKSTLLNTISTLDNVDKGTVFLDGVDISKLTADEQAELRNQKTGFVFQQHYLLPQLTLIENVLVPTLATKNSSKEIKDRALKLIERVGLSELINQKPGQMSVGECQRTAVVRALINTPKILFADEPTGSLDEDSAINLIELLVSLNKEQNLTLIMVTHSMELAKKLNRVVKLDHGKLIEV